MGWRSVSVFLLSVFPAIGIAEHGETGGAPRRPRLPVTLGEQVKGAFNGKCMVCHEGDGRFDDNGMPTDEWRDKILDSVNHKAGVKPMPPASQDQLTGEELRSINEWAGIEIEDEPGDACSEPPAPRNLKMITQILGDRCVGCHGKLSSNPTSVLRSSHTQFLNNDGSFDFSGLGDMSEIQPYNMPEGKTSFGRILDSLTNYTMPPRGNLPILNRPSNRILPELGTPHMTTAERQFLISFLNEEVKRQNCPPKDFTTVIFTKSRRLASEKYEDAPKSCAKSGKKIPTHKQLTAIQAKVVSRVNGEGCVWTSTFAEARGRKGEALRKRLSFRDGEPVYGWATESYRCRTVCVD